MLLSLDRLSPELPASEPDRRRSGAHQPDAPVRQHGTLATASGWCAIERPPASGRRSGFTIVELLVSLALIIFIMSILAGAFDSGIATFRRLKAIGDMSERLRAASNTLRRYLSAYHFDGTRRLSDVHFWDNGPPTQGFFRIYQGSSGTSDGTDLDLNKSFRSVDHGLHFFVKLKGNTRGDFFRGTTIDSPSPLIPTLPLPAGTLGMPGDDFFRYPDSRFQDDPNTLSTRWAEVAIFMVPSDGDFAIDPNNPTTQQQLYTLYLRQRAAIPDNQAVTALALTNMPIKAAKYVNYVEWSCNTDETTTANLYFNGPGDLTMPARRLGLSTTTPRQLIGLTPMCWTNPTATVGGAGAGYPRLTDEKASPDLTGNDIFLTNVLSFDVRILLQGGTDFVDLFDASVTAFANPGNTSFGGAGQPMVFDTWSQTQDTTYPNYSSGWSGPKSASSIPLYQNAAGTIKIRIRAIQITMRVWDEKTQQTRQASVVQDL
jgi:type II secretory pathway pseudopilin PulG